MARLSTLVILAVVVLLGAAACGGRGGGASSPAVPGPTDIPPPSLTERPDGRARAFLDLVRAQKFDEAYAYLGTDARARVSQMEFAAQLEEAMKTASTRRGYENRWVQSERIEGSIAVVTLTDRKYPQAQPWRWEFTVEDGQWRIRKLYLPPLMTHPGE